MSGGFGINGPILSREIEVLGKFACKIPPLPEGIFGHAMVMNNSNELMVLGGDRIDIPSDKSKLCFILKNNQWTHHSTLIRRRVHSSAIVMPDGIYIFGGRPFDPPKSHRLCEYLPNNELIWTILDTHIPRPGLSMSSGIALSPSKIIFTGGVNPASRCIITFNTLTKNWKMVGELNQGRWGHTSFLFNGKIIIAGGKNNTGILSSTEILTIKSRKPREVGRLFEPRWGHGIGVGNIKGTQKLLVFGGWSVDNSFLTSVEAWNDDEECWEKTDLHLPQELSHFAYCSKSERNQM